MWNLVYYPYADLLVHFTHPAKRHIYALHMLQHTLALTLH
jgi:ribosomal silencing factor RsfS